MADAAQAPRDANASDGRGDLRTWSRLVGMVLAAALIGAASAAAWKASRTTTGYQWYAVGMLVLSETLIDAGLDPRRPKEIRHPDGRAETVTLGAIAGHRPLLALRERMIGGLLDAALAGLAIGAGIAVAVLAALHYAGGRLKRGRRLRGGEPVSASQLRRRVAPPGLRLPFRPVSEAAAAVDLWGPDLPPPGNGNPASASRPGAAPPAIGSGANEEKASAVRPNPGAERSEAAGEPRDATRPGGGMIRI